MSPIPKPFSIPELHRRLSDTRKAIARQKCVFWLLLGLTLFGIGFLLVHPHILTGILVLVCGALSMGSSSRIDNLKAQAWFQQKDILTAENRRGEVETN